MGMLSFSSSSSSNSSRSLPTDAHAHYSAVVSSPSTMPFSLTECHHKSQHLLGVVVRKTPF
jgi:hypothetical protein